MSACNIQNPTCIQLLVAIFFFGLSAYLLAFIWLVALCLMILATTVSFYRISDNGR